MHPDTHLELYRMDHAARARALQRRGPQPRAARPARTRDDRKPRRTVLRRRLAHR
ncbi:hypothetical protein BH23ACT10_BH23ACT10_37820 [soil metagenome]